MEEWGKPGGEESGKLEGDRAASSAGGSKYCVWIRSPNRIADHKWRLLEEVGGGWNGE